MLYNNHTAIHNKIKKIAGVTTGGELNHRTDLKIMIDIALYRKYLEQYVREAVTNSDGTNPGIANYLWSITVSGLFVRHKEEKTRALNDARRAFDEHRHWPLSVILSHLGVDLE